MSGPTRGMVAGKAIQTQAQTQEFDEGYDRIYGENHRPQRGRWVYIDGRAVQVDEKWAPTERRAQTATEELTYGGAVATDGTPINSRKRHREYLKTNGLAMASDYSKDYHERESRLKESKDNKHRRETIERAWHKSTNRR